MERMLVVSHHYADDSVHVIGVYPNMLEAETAAYKYLGQFSEETVVSFKRQDQRAGGIPSVLWTREYNDGFCEHLQIWPHTIELHK